MPRRANSLYVRHLPDSCRHEDLRRAFGRYGRIIDITIPLDFNTGRMKGFAFIEYPFLAFNRYQLLVGELFFLLARFLNSIRTFEDPRDAEDAHYNMDHTRFMGRDIEVEFTRGYRKSKIARSICEFED
ncbi:hypothetical protein X801_09749, partial [Opisthorchis viverrini]